MSAKNPDKNPRRRDPRGRYVEDTGAAGEHDSPDAISQAASSLWYLSHGQNAGRSKPSAANGSSGGNPLAQWGAGSLRDNSGFGAQPGDDGGDGPPDHSDESDDDDESGSDNDSESDDDAEEDSADMMLRFVAEETQACSKTDDVGILINNIDIQDISPSVVSMFNTEPRSMTVLLPALKKLVPVIQNLCKELSEAIKEGTEGSKLRSHLYRFLTEFTGAFRGHSFIASAALLMIISEHRNKSDDKAASRLFNLSYRAVKYVRHYCSLHTNKVREFITHASQGELTGSMECIAGSVGLLRLSSENKRLTKDTLIFIKGLIEYVCYEELDLSSAKDVCELLEIDIGDSDALLRMTDEETAEQWENRYRAAVEDAMRVCIQRNEPWRFPAQQKVLEYLQEGCTNPLWTQVMGLLDFEEVIWEQLDFERAWDFFRRAQRKTKIRTKNRRRKTAEPSKKSDKKDKADKKDTAPASRPTGAAGEAYDASKRGTWHGKALGEFAPGTIDHLCRHFVNDSCYSGADCPFSHDEKAKVAALKLRQASADDAVPEEGFKGLKKAPKESKTVRWQQVITLSREQECVVVSKPTVHLNCVLVEDYASDDPSDGEDLSSLTLLLSTSKNDASNYVAVPSSSTSLLCEGSIVCRLTIDEATGAIIDSISQTDKRWNDSDYMTRQLPFDSPSAVITNFYGTPVSGDAYWEHIGQLAKRAGPYGEHIGQLAKRAGLSGSVEELSSSVITDLLESEEARKKFNGVTQDDAPGSGCSSGYASDESVLSAADAESPPAVDSATQLKTAIHDATHLDSSLVLDGIVGLVGRSRGVISFDNHATAGVVDVSVPVESMVLVAPWDNTYIGGFGGSKLVPAGPLYQVNVSFIHGVNHGYVLCRRAELVGITGGLLLVNKLDQRRLKVNIMSEYDEVHVQTFDEIGMESKDVLFTQPIGLLVKRLASPAIVVASFCDSAAFLYVSLLMMGYNVKKYYAVEYVPYRRAIADALCPVMDRSLGNDIREITPTSLDLIEELDLMIGTADCKQFSRRNNNARGFADVEGTLAYVATGDVIRYLMGKFPAARAVVETTEVTSKHGPAWKQRTEGMQEYYIRPLMYDQVQATAFGSCESSPRRFAHNGSKALLRRKASSAAIRMTAGWLPQKDPTQRICARGPRTGDPVKVSKLKVKPRDIHIPEGERLHGFGSGITTAFRQIEVTPVNRWAVLGDSVCYAHWHALLTGLERPDAPDLIVLAGTLGEYPEQFELMLMGLEAEGRLPQWVQEKRGDWDPPEMDFWIKGMPYQCMQPFPVDAKNEVAVMAKAMALCKNKTLKLEECSDFDQECCYSPAFWPEKPGRICEETGMQEFRLLSAMQVINSQAEQPMYSWWKELAPDLTKFKQEFHPVRDKYKVVIDEADAFHCPRTSKRAQKYLKIVFLAMKKLRVFTYLGCPQGFIFSMAFYMYWKHCFMSRILGWVYVVFFAIYADDNAAKGPTPKQAAFRARLLLIIFKEFNVRVSPKSLPLPEPAIEVKIAGNSILEEGYGCDQQLYDTLNAACDKNVKGRKQGQNVLGVLQQTLPGFRYTLGELHKVASALHPMVQDIKNADKFKWSQKSKDGQQTLKSMAGSLPRAFCHPDHLVTDDSCLIMVGDVGDLGAGEAMFRVEIADSRSVVVPDDLQDLAISMLVDVQYSVLDEEESEWLTFINELSRTVKMLLRKAGLLIKAMQGYCTDRDSPDYVEKLTCYADSSYAVGTVSTLHVPTGKIEYATARSRKLANWANDLAFTRNLPIGFKGLPGAYNNLADFLSHMSDTMALLSRQDRREKSAAILDANIKLTMPITLHSYHDRHPVSEKRQGFEEPGGYDVAYMALNDVEWHTLCDAYSTDTTTVINKVSLSSIYKTLLDPNADVPRLERDRVSSWHDKIIAIQVCEDGTPALFMPPTFLRVDMDDDEPPVVPNKLVCLLPHGVKLRVSQAESLYDDDPPDNMDWLVTDLRSDFLLLAHDYSLHARWEEMLSFVRKTVTWPSVITDIEKHIHSCSLCLSKWKAARMAGYGMVAQTAYRHVAIDHKIFPDWLKEATGCIGILGMQCRASGEVEGIMVETTTSIESALTVYTCWIKTRGVMRTITSDNAFDAKAFDVLIQLMGVRVHSLNHIGDSQGLGGPESMNNLFSAAIAEAESKGDVTCKQSFGVYLAHHLSKHNQITVTAGSTVFERTHGWKARTVGDALQVLPNLDTELAALSGENADEVRTMAARMRSRSQNMMESYHAVCDERSRSNAFSKDQDAVKKRAVKFDLRTGDEVSYRNTSGNEVPAVLLDVDGFSAGVPIGATIHLDSGLPGSTMAVKFSSLRPRGTPRPQRLVEAVVVKPVVGSFVLFESDVLGDGDKVVGGVVLSTDSQDLEVHLYGGSESGRSWVPGWKKANRVPKWKKPAAQPAGYSTLTTLIAVDDVMVVGSIKPTFFLTDDTLERMKALRLIG